MSFITKRERVFNEYEMGDLPARNEGKLKTYASCTDARAWSHFWSDKTEHLVDIIKRNNVKCLPKYIPLKVIVDTLMVTKNAEIARLKRKIAQCEQMMVAYENLDLDSIQKGEIAKAHEDIKAATKELDDMCLDLNLSEITEGIASDAFETGKSRNESIMSRGDDGHSVDSEWHFSTEEALKEIKSIQIDMPSLPLQLDASTCAQDPRIDEMQDIIIRKDARLSAMQNTIAVLENDICEPYCIYAHINTALEKIFATLRQNNRYKAYLDALIDVKDIRNLEITDKIIFKLIIFENFCLALMSPCTEPSTNLPGNHCTCYHAEVTTHIETTLALTNEPQQVNTCDAVRSQLVADIMDSTDMKDILSKLSKDSKDSIISTKENEEQTEVGICCNTCSIEVVNLKRLKKLQVNYEELVICYENIKHERNCLQVRLNRYCELELEVEQLRMQLREYNLLWNEKEHFRKRSDDVDDLKERYLVLADEATNLEAQLKAENEINTIKSSTIDELRELNIDLERRLNLASIEFEKDKNNLQCKLKEIECKLMCSEQQIRSLSGQVDSLLEQDQDRPTQDTKNSLILLNEIENLKEQTMNLKEALYCSEEEKKHLQNEFQEKFDFINTLKSEIEEWKSTCEKTVNRSEHLEKCLDTVRADLGSCQEQNKALAADNQEKKAALENFLNIISNKSLEINRLTDDVENKKHENSHLRQQLQDTLQKYSTSITALENENKEYSNTLELVKKESKELFEKIKDYNEIVHAKENVAKTLEAQIQENKDIKDILFDAIEENKRLQKEVEQQKDNITFLSQENNRLRDFNDYAVSNINQLQGEKSDYEKSLDMIRKDSEVLEEKISQYAVLSHQFESLKESHDKVIKEKRLLTEQLERKSADLENALFAMQLTKKESTELFHKAKKSETLEEELKNLSHSYQKLVTEKHVLQKELADKNKELEALLKSFESMEAANRELAGYSQKCTALGSELDNIKEAYTKVKQELNVSQNQFESKAEEIKNLYITLENRIKENRDLNDQIRSLQFHQKKAQSNIATLEAENLSTQLTLDAIKREGAELIDKLKYYDQLEAEYDKVKKCCDEFQIEKNKVEIEKEKLLLENEKLKDDYESKLVDLQRAYDELEAKKEQLQDAYRAQSSDLRRTMEDNREMSGQNQSILNYTEELEKTLIQTRTELTNGNDMNVSYEDLKKEVEIMKQEKITNQNKIRDLLDKLDESENLISSLNEDLLTRDDKIAILENHINQLEEEVRQLHHSLDQAVDCSEELRDSSHQSFRESFKQLEAHHSKATHNMKMELARLKNSQALLEDRLSATLLKAEASQQDQNKYLSQLVQLENEREAIVTELIQLEVQSCGNSSLASNNCSSDEILATIDRIRKTLENTVLKVQTSSQLLRSKADEAMKIVEKEKQKIISEKEEAIQDRLELEKQMKDLKENLGNQIAHDKLMIKDLEAEIQNQKLIIDKINDSTQTYIMKLEEEMHSLQNLYTNSMNKISEQQSKLKELSDENSQQNNMMAQTNASLQEKINEITQLQEKLDKIKTKPYKSIAIQFEKEGLSENRETQTILETKHLKDNAYNWMSSNFDDLIAKKDKDDYGDEVIVASVKIEPQPPFLNNDKREEYVEIPMKSANIGENPLVDNVEIDSTLSLGTQSNEQESKNKDISVSSNEKRFDNNETVDKKRNQSKDSILKDSFSVIKDSYINYKSKLLSPGPLEQHSISSDEESFDGLFENQTTSGNSSEKKALNIITIPTSSSLVQEGESEPYIPKFKGEAEANILRESIHSTSTSDISKDKDVFMIFKDSGSSTAKKSFLTIQDEDNKKKHKLGPKEVIVEAMTIQDQTRHQKINDIFSNQNYRPRQSYSRYEPQKPTEKAMTKDAENKPVLEINMPRAEFYSRSGPTSDDDKMSTESYNFNAASNDTDLIHDSLQPSLTLTMQTYKLSPEPDTTDAGSDEETIGRIIKKENKAHALVDRGKGHQYNMDENEADHSSAIKILRQAQIHSEREGHGYGSHHKLSRVDADMLIFRNNDSNNASTHDSSTMILNKDQNNAIIIPRVVSPGESHYREKKVKLEDKSVLVKLDTPEEYEKKINYLTKALEDIEKDSKKKIDAIKIQYDANIKSFINEHNQGVKNMQSLHEETLQDILKIHENEVDNLRSMSIEAMRKAEKIEKENVVLKSKFVELSNSSLDQEPVKMASPKSLRTRRMKSGPETKKLTKTNVEAFDVRPKLRTHGPCTCSLDVNISDTVRNIFDQVDSDQRKLAEQTYLKYIVNKVTHTSVEDLDAQELSFLHFKVCRSWKNKISKEEALQKRIDTLEVEVMNKQRNAQQHMVELDRQVAEERRRLQEVREAVCREPIFIRDDVYPQSRIPPGVPAILADKDISCNCDGEMSLVQERRSAGDLRVRPCCSARAGARHKRHKVDANKATLTKMDAEERRERRLQSDEQPTRLRRTADKPLAARRDRQK